MACMEDRKEGMGTKSFKVVTRLCYPLEVQMSQSEWSGRLLEHVLFYTKNN